MLPAPVSASVERSLSCKIRHAEPIGGGCIAHATRLKTDDGVFFLKWVAPDEYDMLRAEARGLEELSRPGADLVIPDVVALIQPSEDKAGMLILQWIESGRMEDAFWSRFGRALAQLHRCEGASFGFAETNFIGRLPQQNEPTKRWPDFFRLRRLKPQVDRARSSQQWHGAWDRPLERLLHRLDDLLPEYPAPSLLHGDLWSGNFIATNAGQAALIDPAVYYGHREADLAMTELFGGFVEAFYAAYDEEWPLEPGYAERRDLYNLYHLINHLNHFGASYASSVERVLSRFR